MNGCSPVLGSLAWASGSSRILPHRSQEFSSGAAWSFW
jgi:hypothetical protein